MHYFKTETADWLYRFLGTVWMEEKLGDRIDPESRELLREGKKAALESLKSLYDNAKHNKELRNDSMFGMLEDIFGSNPEKKEQQFNELNSLSQPRIKPRGLYGKLWERVRDMKKDYGETIPYADVYKHICRTFCIKKPECKEMLLILRDFGSIEIKKRGIKINS